ncbi:hypothetical protein ACWD25_50715 [Streptomyces sp. NPDC002920]
MLGILLGLMACSDLNGMVTKAALGDGAAMMAADMVPPLAMALAAKLRASLFTEAERNYSKVSWLLGAAFVPEGCPPVHAGRSPTGDPGGQIGNPMLFTAGSW